MLACGAAEAVEGVFRHIVTALQGNFLDRVCHILYCDTQEALGNFFGADGFALPGRDLFGHIGKLMHYRSAIQLLVTGRAKNGGEVIRLDLPQHDIAIGHRQRTTAPVAGRAGVGAGRLRPYPEAGPVEPEYRAAACRNRMDMHHRRTHAHTGDQRFETALIFAVIVTYVRGGAAHIETD